MKKKATKRSASAAGRLRDLGEDALIEKLTRSLSAGADVIAAAGDDCAVVRSAKRGHYELLKTDCVVEGVHYLAETPPAEVGWKAMGRCLSDIGAMGGRPCHALVTIVMPGERAVAYVEKIYRGLEKAARAFKVSIVGGETSRTARGAAGGMISVTLTGEVAAARCVFRSGGRPEDRLYVTGALGGSLAGKHLRFMPRIEEGAWLAEEFPLHAMMDLSDGLAADLPRLARASGTGFAIDPAAVPRTRGCLLEAALGDGEDFELLFSLSPRHAAKLERAWAKRFPKLPLSAIGKLTEDRRDGSGLAAGGWKHF